MVKKSKLLAALDAHKGRDYAAEKRKSQVKAAEKRKRQRLEAAELDATEPITEPVTTLEAGDKPAAQDFEAFSENGSEGGHDQDDEEMDDEVGTTTIPQPDQPADASASEAENDSDVALSELDEDDLEDTIPHQRLTINNGPALAASRKRIALLGKHRTSKSKSVPFHIHNSLISTLPSANETISDPNDDLTREVEFYRIARDAAVQGRGLLQKEKVPFTRPTDYFAEMVKTDEHMGKIKKKMYDDAAGKKASQEARKLRDAKKFGKAVQVAKEQERAKEKRNTLDKIKELKRKRKGQDTGKVHEGGDDLFQSIDVEDGPAKDRSGRERGPRSNGPNNIKRQKRDEKFGFGGRKRFSKSGDAVSSGDMRGFSTAKMKGKSTRLGKSRRAGAGAR